MYTLDNVRDEKVIFRELENLCQQAGYAHIIAFFCFRDNSIFSNSEQVTTDDILGQYNENRLIRNEISLLIGLMCKKALDLTIPEPQIFQETIEKTEYLLAELHSSMIKPSFDSKSIEEWLEYIQSGKMLREPIFYTGESAYHFQYRDLSKLKYSYDNEWFTTQKGYSVEQLYQVIVALEDIQVEKIKKTLESLQNKNPLGWTILPGYIFSIQDIFIKTELEVKIIENIINSFSFSERDNDNFNCINDFNAINAYPILPLGDDNFLLFQYYSLVEALYETPFFWFTQDSNYKNKAMEHRGRFTEDFSYERLKLVFGEKNVFKNVDIKDTNSNKLGEIDVLVIFGNRAIILQAKAKKLTILARAGNDNALHDDFKKAIQASYDQAVECGKLLLEPSNKLILSSGEELNINRNFTEIYPLSIVSDHYPALATQARHFLKQEKYSAIKPAFVIDVFTLDVITEILQTPLYFLSYINRRVMYGNKLHSAHELTVLSYHLKNNLYLDEENLVLSLDDNLNAELDLVMQSKRTGLSNKDIPDGILTKYQGTFFDRLIKDIENNPNPKVIDLGFELLMLNEVTVSVLNENVNRIQLTSIRDRKLHDLTLTFDTEASCGLTIHCTNDPYDVAMPKLDSHCMLRKYKHKSDRWFGIAIDIDNARVRFGVNKIYNWQQSDEMDQNTESFPFSRKMVYPSAHKVGRNEPCPCGSGKKYKKCCIPK
ncbi:YecA family protein [Basfia succiniciproducens]|uniref:Preprotein translocase subunit SecA (ATPase, RNA helicase) n=1 Tax=Basfia succiniciproducens TaxID=653940 RepID=A0A1G5E8R2_9PAST|nr:SEC-C metal-binding domain-containing protein [Basfia succiniciproducens]QIM69283.1 prepilin peptidase [Basfia succiniciproducens]SCY23369.1 Preprotein translocase subunit SecA (ATPase, RNA helicase) [Basfia succiniciproducens]